MSHPLVRSILIVGAAALMIAVASPTQGDPTKPAAPAAGKHWAFVPPLRPQPPAVRDAAWVRSPIDRFVLAKLEADNLNPSPEADRYTLIRRLSLDLTGLPPTPAEADAFANDTAADAYEKVVDRLLASPRYGEHWARVWLDLARYADTQGYEKDNHRDMWAYRDWVIAALNADMPFDRFTLEQIAGDLLPDANDSTRLATAFHRNTMTNTEGGTDDEEYRGYAVKDRVDTTLQVWMGLTAACAKCHSHKYDPISIEEYYRFYAYFNQTGDHDGYHDDPRAQLRSPIVHANINEKEAELAALRTELGAMGERLADQRRKWEATLASAKPVWLTLIPQSATSAEGATLTPGPDGAVLASGKAVKSDTYTIVASLGRDDLKQPITAIRLEALTDPSLDKQGPGRKAADPNYVVNTFEVVAEALDAAGKPIAAAAPAPIKLANARADFSQNGWPVAGAIDDDPKTGWAISPQFSRSHVAVFDLAEPWSPPADAASVRLTVAIRQLYGDWLVIGKARLSVSTSAPASLSPVVGEDPVAIARVPEAKRTPQQWTEINDAFLAQHADTSAKRQRAATLEAEIEAATKGLPATPVMVELPPERQRKTRIHNRGNFLDPGEFVTPALPAALHPMPEGAPENRLGVARWLTARNNPLTARVAVNRIWARLFGIGIVETEEDFGTQGIAPTNQPLLDYLAVEYMDAHGWSQKKLLRAIVTSATYRQSGAMTPASAAADPFNQRLARGPRFRLSAEQVRDQALAVSGLLSAKMGGPSVMPPQPEGVWRTVYNGANWKTPDNEDRYRRGLYTYWRRTSPYPSMINFDAGSGEVCLIRRIRTNTPLQALVLMNDPVYVEAASALAARSIRDGGADARSRIAHAFRLVLIRPPTDAELLRLTALHAAALAEFRSDSEAAGELLAAGRAKPAAGVDPADLAAFSTLANVLLNLDEAVTKP